MSLQSTPRSVERVELANNRNNRCTTVVLPVARRMLLQSMVILYKSLTSILFIHDDDLEVTTVITLAWLKSLRHGRACRLALLSICAVLVASILQCIISDFATSNAYFNSGSQRVDRVSVVHVFLFAECE